MTNLDGLIENEITQSVAPEINALAENIISGMRNSDGVLGVILYGSGLWQSDVKDCIWDLYVLVERFEDDQKHIGLRIAGTLLPPNVYFIERPLTCKYAVMRMDQFERGASDKAFKPQIWARFAQPCRLIYTRDEQAKKRIVNALSSCVLTFHKRTLPLLENISDARTVWTTGLSETYGSELRSENNNRVEKIFAAAPKAYEQRTKHALDILGTYKPPPLFHLRRVLKLPVMKILYFLQLMKAALTFQNGVDYALWKIHRHSGIQFEASEFQRKYPLIGAWPLLWKIYRMGGLR